jgi:hypothetical protein
MKKEASENIKIKVKNKFYYLFFLIVLPIIGKFDNYLSLIILIIPFIILILYLYKVQKLEGKKLMKTIGILILISLYTYYFKFSKYFILSMIILSLSFIYIKKLREIPNKEKFFLRITGLLLFLNSIGEILK